MKNYTLRTALYVLFVLGFALTAMAQQAAYRYALTFSPDDGTAVGLALYVERDRITRGETMALMPAPVDTAGIALRGNTLRGTLQWAEGKVDVTATLAGDAVQGAFTGTLAGTAATGKVSGTRAALPVGRIETDWPSYLGANSSFSETSGVKLLDDMTKAKLVWCSEERGIGFGKCVSSAMRDGFGKGTGLPVSGEASPIIAGGLLIQAYYVPSGNVYDARGEASMGAAYPEFKQFWQVAADDVVIAIDAATGRTKWKAVFAGKGINYGAGKRGGWAVTPCAADGKVFAMGTSGRLYGMDLATGKVLWESNIGAQFTRIETLKQDALVKKQLATTGLNVRPYGILVYADGTLLAPDWAGGVLGIDPASGKELWRATAPGGLTSGFNAPVAVIIDGKTYAACVNYTGDLRLLNLQDGRVLWTHALKSQHLTQPVCGQELLLVYDAHPKYTGDMVGKSKEPNALGLLAGYRLTETGAERVWQLPAQYMTDLYLDAGPARKTVARNGLVYTSTQLVEGEALDKATISRKLVIVREKDGQVLGAHDVSGWNLYLWGDRLITVTDIQHRPRAANPEIWQAHDPDPAAFRALGAGWHVNGASQVHIAVGGYELPLLDAFADGLVFCRVWGGFRCYDLRQ